jgi:hypothetical protein
MIAQELIKIKKYKLEERFLISEEMNSTKKVYDGSVNE